MCFIRECIVLLVVKWISCVLTNGKLSMVMWDGFQVKGNSIPLRCVIQFECKPVNKIFTVPFHCHIHFVDYDDMNQSTKVNTHNSCHSYNGNSQTFYFKIDIQSKYDGHSN